MSIVNEALKKAAREDAKEPLAEKQGFSFSVKTSFIRTFFYRSLTVLSLVFLLAVVFTQRDFMLRWWSHLHSAPKALNRDPAVTNSSKVQASLPNVGPTVPPIKTNIEQRTESVQEEAERRLKLGVQLFQDKKFKEAEQEFLKVVSLQPENASAHNNLGLTLKAQGRPADAEVEYLAALQRNPKYPEAFNNLGLLYEQQGRVQEAIHQYRKAIEISPDYPEAHLNYAQVLERAGYPEEARRHYQSFLATDVGVPSSLRLRVQQHLDSLP
jgi:tetratricopeptide (TPR) repeat protein